MSIRNRNILILIGVITILSLATVAIAPVLAQTGASGAGTVTLKSGDTLGAIVSRYHLSGNDLRSFFGQNQSLNLVPGQTVTFPVGMTVNLPANSQKSSSSSATTSQTYVTQSGDTLGQVLGFMGFSATSGNSSSSTSANATAAVTPTTAATAAATMAATPTTAATTAATPTTSATMSATATSAATAAATAVGTATPVAAAASSSGNGSVGPAVSAPTDKQLQEFVKLNQGLAFAAGQSITLPTGVAVTGNSNNSSNGANTTTYTIQSGDTLQSLANKFGITIAQLLALNPNLLTPGMTINVPSSSGNIPQTGNNGPQSFTVKNEETLGQIESFFGLGAGQMTAFFTANCNATVVPGQTVRFPIAVASQGSTGSQQFTYVTKQGDTLCTLVNMMGLNLSQGVASSSSNSSSSSSNSAAAATATPAATSAATSAATPTTSATMAATPTGAATSAATPTTAATTAATATVAATTAATPTVAATTAATPTVAATTAVTPTAAATTAANTSSSSNSNTTTSSNGQGAFANNQEGLLREFFKFNRSLKLENGQTLTMGNVIPATGGSSSTTSNTTSSSTTNTTSAAAAVNPANSNAFNCDIPVGRGLYRISGGESLASIAKRFGVTVQQIVDLNPGRTAYGKGDVIFMPAVEAPGVWNMTALGCNDAPNPAVNTTSR